MTCSIYKRVKKKPNRFYKFKRNKRLRYSNSEVPDSGKEISPNHPKRAPACKPLQQKEMECSKKKKKEINFIL